MLSHLVPDYIDVVVCPGSRFYHATLFIFYANLLSVSVSLQGGLKLPVWRTQEHPIKALKG